MNFWLALFMFALIVWGALCGIMMPVYLIRRKRNPDDETNTLKALMLKSFLASIIFVVIFYSGLILMWLEEIL